MGFIKSDCLDWKLMLSCIVATSKALQYLSSIHPDAAVEIALVFNGYVLLFFHLRANPC